MFIAFESIDCCGKTTISNALLDELHGLAYDVKLVKFPLNMHPNYNLYELLEKGDETLSYKMALDRFLYFATNSLYNNQILIADRYAYSGFAYNNSKLSMDELYDFEFNVLNNPKPDLIIYLEASFRYIEKLLKDRRINSSIDLDLGIQSLAKERYELIFSQMPNVIRFNIEHFSVDLLVETIKKIILEKMEE